LDAISTGIVTIGIAYHINGVLFIGDWLSGECNGRQLIIKWYMDYYYGLLPWQRVSDFIAGPAGCLLTVFTLTLVLLPWQKVSNFMAGPAGCLLTVFTLTLVLLPWQKVSDFMAGPAGCLLTVFTTTLVLFP